jgi:hypothetical protein
MLPAPPWAARVAYESTIDPTGPGLPNFLLGTSAPLTATSPPTTVSMPPVTAPVAKTWASEPRLKAPKPPRTVFPSSVTDPVAKA